MAKELGFWEYTQTNDTQYFIRECLVIMLEQVGKISKLVGEANTANLDSINEIGSFADEIENEIIDRLKVCRDCEKYCLSQIERIKEAEKGESED